MAYECTIDGATITAFSEEGLKAGLAAHAAYKSLEGNGESLELPSDNSKDVLFTYDNGNVTIQMNLSGEIETNLTPEDE